MMRVELAKTETSQLNCQLKETLSPLKRIREERKDCKTLGLLTRSKSAKLELCHRS